MGVLALLIGSGVLAGPLASRVRSRQATPDGVLVAAAKSSPVFAFFDAMRPPVLLKGRVMLAALGVFALGARWAVHLVDRGAGRESNSRPGMPR
jgi:hypothetical protein